LKTPDLLFVVAAAAALCGCASTVPGDSQDIQLSVMPEMARCDAVQHGMVVGSYDPARRAIAVPRSQGSVDIFCSAAGYKDKRINIVPDNSARGFAGVLTLDFGPVDPSYPNSVQIEMEPADRQGQPT